MTKTMYSVFDTKARCFANPFFSINRFTALRDFNTAANDPGTNIFRYPQDYVLYELGCFDDENGMIFVEPQPVNLGTALQFSEVQPCSE